MSVDDLVERWHKGYGEDLSLREFLGMTWDEYDCWLETGRLPQGYEAQGR